MDTVIGAIGGLIGALGGIGGAVVGILSWRRAGQANQIAQAANGIAEGAKQEAQTANQLSAESNTIAREANTIAVDANELAEDANAAARLRQGRDEERNDVVWDGDWEAPGRYVLVNSGQDEALGVVAVVTVDGVQRTLERERVDPGGRIAFDFPEAACEFMREKQERARRSGGPFPDIMAPTWFQAVEHITWRTQLGIPRVHDRVQNTSSMD